jgi:hypothetical protein
MRKMKKIRKLVLCETCKHRTYPEMALIPPGSNVKCEVNHEYGQGGWTFPKTECDQYLQSGDEKKVKR